MRIVYFGTASFAVAPLKALLAARKEYDVVMVVSQPDRPAGRAGNVVACPVAVAAREAGLKLLQPEKIRTDDVREQLAALKADVFIVAAYGKIIPKAILDLPRLACLNLHGSLLPKYRGASPIQAAIAAGENVTGVSLMVMDEDVDHGPVLATADVPIAAIDTHATLESKLGEAAAALLIKNLPAYAQGKLVATIQKHDVATHTSLIDRNDGFIDWTAITATEIERRLRAYTPWPGIFTIWMRPDKKGGSKMPFRIKILDGAVIENRPGVAVGTAFIDPESGEVAIAAKEDAFHLRMLQPEGKKPMDGKTFLNGYADFSGAVMETTLPKST